MRFILRHATTYRYANPVKLGRHRLMLRPRDSHEMRLHGATLRIAPTPSQIQWQYDVFGNSIALVEFAGETTELVIDSTLEVERFPFVDTQHLLSEHARSLPLAYSAEEIRDLAGLQERHVPDPDHVVDQWAKGFLGSVPNDPSTPQTLAVLNAMTFAIKNTFSYVPRDAYGTQSPLETLQRASGTCRDFAYLLMEGARSIGLAARFVSGYIYGAGSGNDEAGQGMTGGGATHAWAQIYLPGAGWTHFDPTNALVSDAALIPVAVVREPLQASPVMGSFEGMLGDAMQLDVMVVVNRSPGS